jgi:hypothetical protein
MRRGTRLYLAFGLAVLGLLGWAEYRGWSMLPTREERAGPRSVRDNPGAYRSPYVGTGRYTGGK